MFEVNVKNPTTGENKERRMRRISSVLIRGLLCPDYKL